MKYRLSARPAPELSALLVLVRGLPADRDAGDPRREAGTPVQLRPGRGATTETAAAAR
jgi:hypothetical protein